MKTRFLIIFAIVLIAFFTISLNPVFAIHDPEQSLDHSIIFPPDMREKTFDEFMEWCIPFYDKKCTELYDKNHVSEILSPLKQFTSGSSFNEIQCKENLALIQKYDGSPACVKPETKQKLIERDWAERLPPVDLHSKERIAREVGYLGLLMLLPHIGQNETIAVSLEGRPNLVMQMTDYYGIDIMSTKKSSNDSFLSLFGNMTKPNLQKFFEEAPMNNFAKRGILLVSLGGYTDNSGTYGPFNDSLTNGEAQKIGRILEYYENKRTNNEDTNWNKIIEWPTGKISDKYFSEYVEYTREVSTEPPQIPQNDMYCWTLWWVEPTSIDEDELIASIQETIAEFGSHVDISDREISVYHRDERTVISVAGSWTEDKTQHQELTDIIKDFIGDSKIKKDDLILCT